MKLRTLFDRFSRISAGYRFVHKWGKKPEAERSWWERQRLHWLTRWFDNQMSEHYGAWISADAVIPNSVIWVHQFHGVFLASVVLGERCIIHQHVTLGASTRSSDGLRHSPRLGNDVIVGANATLIGECVIGDGARIGAGVTLVNATVPAGAVIVNKSAYDLTNKRYIYPQD